MSVLRSKSTEILESITVSFKVKCPRGADEEAYGGGIFERESTAFASSNLTCSSLLKQPRRLDYSVGSRDRRLLHHNRVKTVKGL